MIPPKFRKKIQHAAYRYNYSMRALAAYYRHGAKVHPDPSMTGHYIVQRSPSAELVYYLDYVRLANAGGTLAVYRVTNRGELKRLKRWPRSVEDGSAETFAQFNDWLNGQLDREEEQAASKLFQADNDDLESLLDKWIA